jgi:uncharacterized membrane protein YgcG
LAGDATAHTTNLTDPRHATCYSRQRTPAGMEAAEEPDSFFSIWSRDGTLDLDERDVSSAANLLLCDAVELCEELRHKVVEPAHVAFLLFSGASIPGEEGYSSIGTRILDLAGVDREDCREFLKEELGMCESGGYSARSPQYSHDFVVLMQDAEHEARRVLHDELIGLDSIACALALHLADFGAELGIGYQQFRHAAAAVRDGLPPPPPRRSTSATATATAQLGHESLHAVLQQRIDGGEMWEQDGVRGRHDGDVRGGEEEVLRVQTEELLGACTDAEIEALGLGIEKLDRVSPASSAPDSPQSLDSYEELLATMMDSPSTRQFRHLGPTGEVGSSSSSGGSHAPGGVDGGDSGGGASSLGDGVGVGVGGDLAEDLYGAG